MSTLFLKPKEMSDQDHTNLHINVKGVTFHLHKEYLAKRSAKVRLLLELNEIKELCWILQEIEADPKAFELVVRFCYGYEVKLSSDNIVSVLCIAYYLEMKEEHSSNNLLGKASTFLETQVFPSWNETVNALRSGDKCLDKLADVGLVDLFLDSLVEKASYDPRLLGETLGENDEYRPNPRRRLFIIDWKSEDLITIPLRFYELLMIRAMKSRSIPAEYIVSSVCRYAKKWVFDGKESVSGQKKETVEAIERLLPHQRGLISCEFLFESLKHSIWLEANSECRNGFEIRIIKQLDIAKPTEIKILTRGYGEKAESFEDIKLVKAVIISFYSNYAEEDSSDNVLHFVKVAKLFEEFLFLAASEASLKLKIFVELAEIAVATSQGILKYSDGIYRAIDVFLESHIYLTESEKIEACEVLDCKRLSQEGCEKAAKNQRLPLRIVVRVLVVSQLHIRDIVAKETNGIEEKAEEEWVSIDDEDEAEKISKKLLGLEIENQECVVHQWKKKKKKKRSVWREVKRKFSCLTSPSTSIDDCTCNVKKKKKKIPCLTRQ